MPSAVRAPSCLPPEVSGRSWPYGHQLATGPRTGPELQEALEISQPSLSRLVARCADDVVPFGHTWRRQYALRRASSAEPAGPSEGKSP